MAPFFPRFKGIAVERWNRCRERKHLLRGTTITRIEDHPLIPPVGRGHLQHDDSPPGFAEEAQRLHGKRVIGLTFAFVLSWKLTSLSLSLSAIFVVNRFRGAILADVTQRPRNFTVLRLLDSTRGAWMGSILIGFGCEISRAIASSPKTFFFSWNKYRTRDGFSCTNLWKNCGWCKQTIQENAKGELEWYEIIESIESFEFYLKRSEDNLLVNYELINCQGVRIEN